MQTGTQWFMYLISQEISSNTYQQGKHSQELQRDTVTLKAELAGSLAETKQDKEKSGLMGLLGQQAIGNLF